MAHPKGHTMHVHEDPKVQQEFERAARMNAAKKEVVAAPAAPAPASDIIITSKDKSLLVNKYDLSVWNYQTKWDYYEHNIAAPNDLPANRGAYGGWIPFRCDKERIVDSQDWVDILSSKNYEPDYGYDTLATGDYTRNWWVFKPQKTGTYYVEAQVIIKLQHSRSYDYYDAITRGALALVKVDYDTMIAYTKYAPNVTRTGTTDDDTVDDWCELFDSQVRFNYDALDAMSTADITAYELPHLVKRIDLNGSSLVHIAEGECIIPWYKFDSYHIYDTTGGGVWTESTFSYHSYTELYETVSVHFVGLDGVVADSPNSLKNLIKYFYT